MSWRRAGRWAAALVLLFACNQAPKNDPAWSTYWQNPKGPPTGTRRVERGGAFFLPRRGVTATIRYNHPPDFALYFLGFRCAQDP